MTIYKFAWGLLILLCMIGLACIFVPKCQSLRALHRRKLALQEENRRAEGLIRDLRVNQERFAADSSFVERVAREGGMVKPDETVFKFAPEEPAPTEAGQ